MARRAFLGTPRRGALDPLQKLFINKLFVIIMYLLVLFFIFVMIIKASPKGRVKRFFKKILKKILRFCCFFYKIIPFSYGGNK